MSVAAPPTAPPSDRALSADLRLLGLFALAKIALHLPWLARYGYHRDELYFKSCGARLDWGYADHAPLVPALAALAPEFLGDSLAAFRVLPLLATTATVVLTGLLARALGGGGYAVGLAALCALLAPVFLRTGNDLAIPSFEPVFWTTCGLVLVHLVRGGSSALWLLFGLVAGAGLMNKHTMLMLGFGVAVGVLLTRQRRQLATRWPWLGLGVALCVFLPNLIWQVQNGWPTVTFARQLNEEVMSRIDAVQFLAGQVIYHGPLAAVVWLAGFVWLWFRGGRFRVLAWVYVAVVGVLLTLGGKIYYASPVYPLLFAAGGVALESRLRSRTSRAALFGAVGATGLALAPLSLPVLPIEKVDGFARAATLGLVPDAHEVTGDLHDMLGWPQHARAVADVYAALGDEERAGCLLWGGNYGEAGALEWFWPLTEHPPVASNHLSWHFWGPPPGDGFEVMVALSWSRRHLERMFEEVELVARSPGHPQALEQEIPIWVCRRLRGPLAEVWPERADF